MRVVALSLWGVLWVASCGGRAEDESRGGSSGAGGAVHEAGRSGSQSVAQGGWSAAGAGADCPPIAPSPICDYGLSCQFDTDCLHGACYVPGTGENPICSKRCDSDLDCPAGSTCELNHESGVPQRHCFIACDDEADCDGINEHPYNPVICTSIELRQVCAQESEP